LALELLCVLVFAGYGYAAYKHGRVTERDLWLRRRKDIAAQWNQWEKPRWRKPGS
jgi:hypothetical protein